MAGCKTPPSSIIRQFETQTLESLTTDDWLALDALSHETPLPEGLLPRLDRLLQLGMIVRAGKGRFILNEAYYRFQNREETFRRLRDNEVCKEVLESRLSEHSVDGCPMGELEPLLTKLSRKEVRKLLEELRDEGRVHLRGEKRAARWYPGGSPEAP